MLSMIESVSREHCTAAANAKKITEISMLSTIPGCWLSSVLVVSDTMPANESVRPTHDTIRVVSLGSPT